MGSQPVISIQGKGMEGSPETAQIQQKPKLLDQVRQALRTRPVGVNDTWEFEKNIERKSRMKGKTHIKGQCLLYDIQKEAGQTLALIIVNTESTGEGEFKFKRQDTEISGSTQTKGVATSLVYFDIDRGRITEIVTEETRYSVTESTMFSSTVSTKTKSTIKLISE